MHPQHQVLVMVIKTRGDGEWGTCYLRGIQGDLAEEVAVEGRGGKEPCGALGEEASRQRQQQVQRPLGRATRVPGTAETHVAAAGGVRGRGWDRKGMGKLVTVTTVFPVVPPNPSSLKPQVPFLPRLSWECLVTQSYAVRVGP